MKRLFILTILVLFSCSSQTPKYTVVRADNGMVKIPLKEVSDGRVHFFSFKSGSKIINFFIRMDGAGKLHTCFDACYACYKKQKGYHVEGTDIVCNECGTKFRLADEAWKDVGGCAPIALPSQVRGEFIMISASDLGKGERLF
jgi:uncharacterized membrane protein